jgi:heat shock protein HslJ/uncharacterized coiled-coil protein SlyX
MNKRPLIAVALSSSLLLAALPGLAFGQDDPASSLSPEGAEWALTTLAGETIPAEIGTTLFLSGGEVVGNASCNSYFGSYELVDDALTFPTPFGVTQKFCDGPVQAVEDAYLPLLQTTATWSIDEEGALSLADADGVVQLVYGEAAIDITATDVDALTAALGDLQNQIDEANAEVAALEAEAASINVNKFDKRLTATEASVKGLENKTKGLNVDGLKSRISANEKAIADLQKKASNLTNRVKALENTDANLKKRINALEKTDQNHEKRIAALEEASPTPEQPLP